MPQEQELRGGFIGTTVLLDGTVRRTPTSRSPYVRQLLGLFADQGWHGAPRCLGTDARGRDMFTFVPGLVPWEYDERVAGFGSLEALARLVRAAHDLTAGHRLAGDAEVVCHNDLSYRNTVYRDEAHLLRPVALIDWDLAAPGRRVHDVAHLCWQFLRLGPGREAGWAGLRMRAVADAYGLAGKDRADLVATVLWWQDRCRQGIEKGAAGGDPAMVDLCRLGIPQQVRAARDWTAARHQELTAFL
ncbi:phosphotransferase family protein [Streptomyces sp. NPDC020917]|uniref:phosphotransferase family protein n=1 Tax=Streptomyces sp. NPDC020917 TaxID=3365102 RepID=UPI0037BD22D2